MTTWTGELPPGNTAPPSGEATRAYLESLQSPPAPILIIDPPYGDVTPVSVPEPTSILGLLLVAALIIPLTRRKMKLT